MRLPSEYWGGSPFVLVARSRAFPAMTAMTAFPEWFPFRHCRPLPLVPGDDGAPGVSDEGAAKFGSNDCPTKIRMSFLR
jgi:hypothetical protein